MLECGLLVLQARNLDGLLDTRRFLRRFEGGVTSIIVFDGTAPLYVQALRVLFPVASVAGAVFILRWFHRCYSNLPAIRGSSVYTPGQAVAAWFVPVVNLWYPLVMARELLPDTDGSLRGEATTDEGAASVRPVPEWLLVVCWALFLVVQFAAAGLWIWDPAGIDNEIWWTSLHMARGVASVTAAIVAIVIVRRISVYQDSRLVGP